MAMAQKRYYSYNHYLRKTFGFRVHRLSLNAGFSCPNLDGKIDNQGCIFCSNKAFSFYSQNKRKPIQLQLKESMDFARKRYKARKFIAYFQSFTNTYADTEILSRKYNKIRDYEDIAGISVSTRPDCIDKEKLNLLDDFSKDYKVYIEYGVQSVHDKTLKKINRNHTFNVFKKAVELTQNYKNIHPAAHVILGLPGETKKDMLETARVLAKMPLWGLKIHCLHVVKGTLLFNLYRQKKIKLLSQPEYLDILIDFLRLIPGKFVMLRLVSDANPKELIGPGWLNQKSKVLSNLDKMLEERDLWQGDLLKDKVKS